MKKGGFILKCKKCEILSWLELKLRKGSAQASKRGIEILNDSGNTVMTIESLKREGKNLVIEGRLMGAWKSKMYFPLEAIPKMLRLLANFSVISFILSYPFFYLKGRIKRGK